MNIGLLLASWPGRIGALVLVAAIAGGGVFVMRGNAAAPKADLRTASVARGSVSQTVTVSGSISAQGQARLAFKSGGKIAQIFVTSGQAVTVGQPLAKLDTTDLEAAVATAQQSLANAQASYQKQLLSAQDANKNLAQARQNAANDVAAAQATLNKLKSSYAAAKTNFSAFTDSATTGIANFQNSLDQIQSQVDAVIAEMRLVVGGGDTGDLRNALNSITGANSPALQNARSNSVTLLSPAVADYQTARAAVLTSIAEYDAASAAGSDTSNMPSSFQLTQTNYSIAASRLTSALDTTSSALGSLLTAVTSSQASMNTQATRDLHTPFDQWRADLGSLFNVLNGQQQAVSTLKLKLSQATSYLVTMNDAVGGSIATAAQNIVTTQQRGQQSIDNAQSAVANIPFNLQSAQVSVDNANSAVATATANLDSAILTAPAAGIVASIANQVGEFVSGGNTNSAFMVLTNTQSLVLHGTVGESDVAKLKLGQVANLTVDALAGQRMTGRVVSLDPVATIQQGVPVYGIDIAVDVPASSIKAGMSGSASVILASKQNVLTVPNTAIRTVSGQRGVQVLKDGEVVDTAATFGLANDTVTEVVSGLAEGDVVVIPTVRATTTTANPRVGGGGVQIPGGLGR
ncbi:MAG TPA: efflux RND transporter periplasmic adaptor subunit [Candidatus Limnocylindrales bacterium]|nr:efflux RND transporter periplasmic adaptor subunit [Candidatus Limnocylindrales bacterium]